MRWVGYWVSSFRDAGAVQLCLPVLRGRLAAYADYVLTRVDPEMPEAR
jgi:hypothetical protein